MGAYTWIWILAGANGAQALLVAWLLRAVVRRIALACVKRVRDYWAEHFPLVLLAFAVVWVIASVSAGVFVAFWPFGQDDDQGKYQIIGAFVSAAGFGGGFVALLLAAFQIRAAFPRARLRLYARIIASPTYEGAIAVIALVAENSGDGAPKAWRLETDFGSVRLPGLLDAPPEVGMWTSSAPSQWVFQTDKLALFSRGPEEIGVFEVGLTPQAPSFSIQYRFTTEIYRERRPSTILVRREEWLS